MDPNEILSTIRAKAADVIAFLDGKADVDVTLEEAASELAEATQALDYWLQNGGFLPTGWSDRA